MNAFTGTLVYNKGKWVHAGLEKVLLTLEPFSFRESAVIRKHVKCKNISKKRLQKYMEKLRGQVELKITEWLANHFALIINGWTNVTNQYNCITSSSRVLPKLAYKLKMLGFIPGDHETNFICKQHAELIKFVLSVFSNTTQNVVAVIARNVNVNKAVATTHVRGFIRCASNRFNLAVDDLFVGYKVLVSKDRSAIT